MYGGKYYMGFVGNLLGFPAMKEFWKSVKNWQSYCHAFGVQFFWPTLYTAPTTVNCWSHCSSRRSNSQIFAQNRDFRLPHQHSAPPLRDPSLVRISPCRKVWYAKTRIILLPEKRLRIRLLVLRECTNVTDRRTRHRPRLCIVSRGKNYKPTNGRYM